MIGITLCFPLGMYHAQSEASFEVPEWPPHPVRLIGALIAAACATDRDDPGADRALIERICEAPPPRIVAPRVGSDNAERAPDGAAFLAPLRGASRWAPRNHELRELEDGVSPRNLGRGRAEVHKVGVAIGETTVGFEWPGLELSPEEVARLETLVQDLTVLGTSRSPVVARVDTTGASIDGWQPVDSPQPAGDTVQVRVPTAATVRAFDRWHERRAGPTKKAPGTAPYIPPASVGRSVPYLHSLDPRPAETFDAGHWGEMVILAVDRDGSTALPKAPSAFAVARSIRRALLAAFGDGVHGDAPPMLHGRGDEPHLAVVPLHFVALPGPAPGASHADGHTLGVALLLPNELRCPDVATQREALQPALIALCVDRPDALRTRVRVPGVGEVALRAVPTSGARLPFTLTDRPYRGVSAAWTTVTPIVHSRYLPRRTEQALYEQVAAECRDVGLPEPAAVAIRRGPRHRGAPGRARAGELDTGLRGPLKGPQNHVDIWFDGPVRGPILLGRARHFGIGLCLPFHAPPDGGSLERAV